MSENTPRSGTSLDLTGFSGLSEDEARRNIAEDGPNEIASQEKRWIFAIVIEVVREPMFLMLVAAGARCGTVRLPQHPVTVNVFAET